MTQDTVIQGARFLIVIIEQLYIRLHLVDCVVARSATKLGGLGACPHSREATSINVQYPPLGVKNQYLLILASTPRGGIEYLKYD